MNTLDNPASNNSVDLYCAGLGQQFTNHILPALKASSFVRVRALCDTNRERLSQTADTLGGIVDTFVSAEEMIESACRASIPKQSVLTVSTPPKQHYDIAKAALELGFHVYVDKPLTPELETAKQLAELAQEKHVGLVVGSQRRFEDVFQKLNEMSRSVGKIQRVHVHSHGNFQSVDPFYRENSLLPCGVGYHTIDTVAWLIGQLGGCFSNQCVVGATIRTSRANPSSRVAFECLLRAEFDSEYVPVLVAGSRLAPRDSVDELIIVSGTDGEVQYRRTRAPRDATPGDLYFISTDSHGVATLDKFMSVGGAKRSAPLKHLLSAVSNRRLSYLDSSGDDAVFTQALITQIQNSAEYFEANDHGN